MSTKNRRREILEIRDKVKRKSLSQLIKEGYCTDFYLLDSKPEIIGGLVVGSGEDEMG